MERNRLGNQNIGSLGLEKNDEGRRKEGLWSWESEEMRSPPSLSSVSLSSLFQITYCLSMWPWFEYEEQGQKAYSVENTRSEK